MKTLMQRLQQSEPPWAAEQRQQAWDAFQQMPMPQRYEEDWRRTDLRALKLDDYSPVQLEQVDEPLAWFRADDIYRAYQIQHDGESIHRSGSLPDGVIFTDLGTALREHGDLVRKYLFKQVPVTFNRLVALHAALRQGGTFLYVPRGVTVEEPLLSAVSLQTSGRADLSHTIAVLEENASATLVQEWTSRVPDTSGFHSGVTELYVGDSAQLQYYDVQQWNLRTWDFTVQRAQVGRDSRLDWFTGVIGSRLSKSYREIYLDGKGAEANMRGLFLALGRQHLDLQTHQAHEAENTTSNLLYRGVLTDKARSVFRGMIRVEPEGQITDAYQTNRNLMLSPDARADSIPGLEIEADDVRCSHSAAASPVDEEQMFYLMTRGIPRRQARTMLVYGFTDDVLQQAKLDPIREKLNAAISQLLS